MERAEIKDKLREIIFSSMNLSGQPSDIKGDNLVEEVGLNSVDALEILVHTEITFDIQIDDEDLNAELMSSLDTLANYIENKMKKGE